MNANEKKGKAAFIDYYQTIFKNEINAVIESLSQAYPPVLWFPQKNQSKLKQLWHDHDIPWKSLSWYPQALAWPENLPFPSPLPGMAENLFYPLTPSSLLPVMALELKPDDIVLDACAAPGGKSLVIADQLASPDQLTVNDLSPNRVARLKQTVRQFGFEKVRVMQKPAERISLYHREVFDKILADVPCSSEMHVWHSRKHLETGQLTE
jgi:16S rRNA C967 or C1407 C5-methylase (RsmB/RsmF family)